MIFNLSDHNTVANQFIAELRDKDIQVDRAKFRKNMKKLGQIMAYEISKRLDFKNVQITTPLGVSSLQVPAKQPVLLTVLRAGLPYFEGFLDYFDQSDCGFIGAYRQEGTGEVVVQLDYVAAPDVNEREMILIDPMMATGKSVVNAVQSLLKHGQPAHIHIAALVAAPEGIDFIRKNIKVPHTIYACALDENLNQQFYIVPGLGDAGDLSFGLKL